MKNILIVDDEKNIALSLKIFFKKEGYNVLIAQNGLEAIKIAQDHVPNLIFLDIVLPKLNGYLVCQALREDRNTRNIPIVFMSAKTQQEDIKKAFEIGAKEYIVKPFSYQKIKDITTKYIKE